MFFKRTIEHKTIELVSCKHANGTLHSLAEFRKESTVYKKLRPTKIERDIETVGSCVKRSVLRMFASLS